MSPVDIVIAVTPPGAGQIALVVFLALLLFGGRKLPELGSSVGKTITNFRRGLAEANEEVVDAPQELEDGITVESESGDKP